MKSTRAPLRRASKTPAVILLVPGVPERMDLVFGFCFAWQVPDGSQGSGAASKADGTGGPDRQELQDILADT